MGTRPSATRPAPSRGCPASWCRGVADWGRDARLTVAPNDEELLLGAAVLRMIELDQARRVVRARMGRRPLPAYEYLNRVLPRLRGHVCNLQATVATCAPKNSAPPRQPGERLSCPGLGAVPPWRFLTADAD